MQARRLPAIRGWNWIAEGFGLFRTNPALLTFLVFGYWLTLIFLNLMPLIGVVLAPLAVPALSVGVMNGCRALERKGDNGFGLLYSGFARNRNALFVLGGLYLAGSLAVFAASALFDGGALLGIMMAGQEPPEGLLHSDRLMMSLQITLALMVPVMMAFWFAPMLAAWDDVPPAKALFFSFIACLRNWRAFFAYTACALFFGGILPGILLGVLVAIVPGTASVASTLFMLPLMFVLAPTLVASFYVSYRDVFTDSELAVVTDETGDTPPPPPEDHA